MLIRIENRSIDCYPRGETAAMKLLATFHLLLFSFTIGNVESDGILYPRESETRQNKLLDGFWNFRAANMSYQDQGFVERWYAQSLKKTGPTILMAVPSSYNDITEEASLRDHIGWVWYDREFYVPRVWNGAEIRLRIGSANFHATVWVNGIQVMSHSGGYLPFEADVTSSLVFGNVNLVTVAVNNTLTPVTIPQGGIVWKNDTGKYPSGYYTLEYGFDFYHFSGIHRSVVLYSVPKIHIDDVTVSTSTLAANIGLVRYEIQMKGADPNSVSTVVTLMDKNEQVVVSDTGTAGNLVVNNPHLWWPRGMNDEVGYLYTFKIEVRDSVSSALIDCYRLPIGIRTVTWDNRGLYINSRPAYLKGYGRHEDAYIRGKGLDLVTLVKDFNLMAWQGANSFRTSHYPYSEEQMDLADRLGYMVIDEVPSVEAGRYANDVPAQYWGDELLTNHINVVRDLIQRDKNRPSVIMWSVANEPESDRAEAGPFFKAIADATRSFDSSRPITLVINKQVDVDQAGSYFDITCINRYYSWYGDTGLLDLVTYQLINDVERFVTKYGKPVIMTEYGADAVAGLYMDPPLIWSEDYQLQMMENYFQGFDDLYRKGHLIGEMIWNFADFATVQGNTRVVGNKKGVFTRDRQPKGSARLLRKRYTQLNH